MEMLAVGIDPETAVVEVVRGDPGMEMMGFVHLGVAKHGAAAECHGALDGVQRHPVEWLAGLADASSMRTPQEQTDAWSECSEQKNSEVNRKCIDITKSVRLLGTYRQRPQPLFPAFPSDNFDDVRGTWLDAGD